MKCPLGRQNMFQTSGIASELLESPFLYSRFQLTEHHLWELEVQKQAI